MMMVTKPSSYTMVARTIKEVVASAVELPSSPNASVVDVLEFVLPHGVRRG